MTSDTYLITMSVNLHDKGVLGAWACRHLKKVHVIYHFQKQKYIF